MLPDALTAKYLLLAVAAIWGVLAIIATRRRLPGYILGVTLFLVIAYIALGSGFSIRIPYLHNKMEVIVYTVHDDRVHALAHPMGTPDEPMHIVFSIDPHTNAGARMRKSFFNAVRSREESGHKTNIIINMRGHMTEQGERNYEVLGGLPRKG